MRHFTHPTLFMANIPVEKTASGAAWLPWLLGLLALLALGWLAFALIDDPDVEEVAVVDDEPILVDDDDDMIEPDEAALGTVGIGLDTLRTVGRLSETIAAVRDGMVDASGLAVMLDDVEVQALTGDSTFAIGTGDDRTLVVLSGLGESEDGPGDGSDGVYNVDVGEMVTIDGSLMRYRPGLPGTSDLADEDRDATTRRQYVIVARDRSSFSIAR